MSDSSEAAKVPQPAAAKGPKGRQAAKKAAENKGQKAKAAVAAQEMSLSPEEEEETQVNFALVIFAQTFFRKNQQLGFAVLGPILGKRLLETIQKI